MAHLPPIAVIAAPVTPGEPMSAPCRGPGSRQTAAEDGNGCTSDRPLRSGTGVCRPV